MVRKRNRSKGVRKGRNAPKSPTAKRLARLRDKAHLVSDRLDSIYGSPRHNNKDDPLDEVIFIILSQMTTTKSFNRVYDHLKASIGSWSGLLKVPLRKTKSLIKDAGLSNQKGPRIKAILRMVKEKFGRVSLNGLSSLSDGEAEAFLTSLPGVGQKTAKCVLMYSLGRPVLPVDTNVARLASRLGLIPRKVSQGGIHIALERVVRPEDRYSFHVNGLAHGQRVCRAVYPKCGVCVLSRMCLYIKGLKK
jgi:endonuclease-3